MRSRPDPDTNADIGEIAHRMIQCFGADAPAIMNSRADNHLRTGDSETAAFWRSVSQCVEAILHGHRTSA
jgi:hypothetical protein